MEQPFQESRIIEGTQKVQERRRTIVQEQEREVECRASGTLKVAFRKSDEEDRLIARLSEERES